MTDKARIFIVDDDALISSMYAKLLKNEGYEVETEEEEFHEISDRIESWSPDLVLLDINLPGRNGIEILQEIKDRNLPTQVIMLTSDATAETAVKCMKLGAVDYLTKPFSVDEAKIVIQNALEKDKLRHEVRYLRQVYSELFDREIVGESSAMRELKGRMEKLARARVPSVLVTGESGTGKELVARGLHRMMHEGAMTGRSPFLAVNCTALPEHLLESELFGYDKGAFTDAKSDKKGFFEQAHGGTILLDEVGDMKAGLQSKLLRVLEDRSIRRISGQKEIPVELTVMATTNRDLPRMVEKNEFRLDLFYRLNTFAIQIPPLRERPEDIPVLAKHFLGHFAAKYKNKTVQGISPEAEKILFAYGWPGNVRELKNVMERIVVLETGSMILPGHLPRELTVPGRACLPPQVPFILPEAGLSLEALEKDLIRQALERAKNNKVLAAKCLNISYDSLRYQIKKFGLIE